MTADDKIMLPANMPTVAVGPDKTMWFPKGVFGEFYEYSDLMSCLKAIGDGIYVICSTVNCEHKRRA